MNKKITPQEYAKENTFCIKCHSKKPPSHIQGFVSNHGSLANQNRQKCLACHDYQNDGNSKVTNVTCSTCHPSSHKGHEWRKGHPIQLAPNQKVSQFCYSCHYEPTCSACHK